MAKKNDALQKKWSKLNDLKKLMLQIMAALSDKGADTQAVALVAQAMTGDETVEKRFARNLRDLDKQEVWFTGSGAKSRRKLRAPVRKALVEWRSETPDWPLRFPEVIFDALSLAARDDVQAACLGLTEGVDMRRQKYAQHIADLYPDLIELRAAEAAAVLAMYYAFSQNSNEYVRWRKRFAEWVEFTPLPQTPLLFLGATDELQYFQTEDNILGYYNGRFSDADVLRSESEGEYWDLTRADALAEYLQDVVPGDQASVYCALTLRALAAGPAWYSERDPQVARERLGAYGPAFRALPLTPEPHYQTLARRTSMLTDLFCPLAALVEDYFGEFGPGCRYLFEKAAELATAYDYHGMKQYDLTRRFVAAVVERQYTISHGYVFGNGPELVPFGAEGTGEDRALAVRNAYATFLPRQLEALKHYRYQANYVAARFNGLLKERPKTEPGEWLKTVYLKGAEMRAAAERRYFFARADQLLADEGLSPEDLADEGGGFYALVNMELAKTETLVDPEGALELARGFAALHGARSLEAREFMQRQLVDFYLDIGLPFSGLRALDEWRTITGNSASNPILRALQIEAAAKRAECFASAGRTAEAGEAWPEAFAAFAKEPREAKSAPEILACVWKFLELLERAALHDFVPDVGPGLAALEQALPAFDGGGIVIPALRAKTYLMLCRVSDFVEAKEKSIIAGLVAADRFFTDEWSAALRSKYDAPAKTSPESDPMLYEAHRILGALKDKGLRELAGRYAPRRLTQAALAVAAASAKHSEPILDMVLRDSPRDRSVSFHGQWVIDKALEEIRKDWPPLVAEAESALWDARYNRSVYRDMRRL